MAIFVFHFYAHGVAELHEIGRRFAVEYGFDGAFFGDAAIAFGPVFAAIGFNRLVADGAAADDAAGAHIARLGQVGDQLAEMKRHLGTGVAHADAFAIPIHPHAQVQTAMFPSAAKLIRRHRHRAERGRRFALQKAEVLGQFDGNQPSQ